MQLIKPNWPAPKEITAFTTTRAIFGNPNLQHKSEQALTALQSIAPLPNPPIFLKQTHSTLVYEASANNIEREGDALYTNQRGVVCGILTADCLPVLLAYKNAKSVAAIHAGWRGLAGGIIENTVVKLDGDRNDWLAWLGPAIGPQHFEVGEDVYQAFTSLNPEYRAAFSPHGDRKWFANLYLLARLKLYDLGINQVFGGDYCTYSQASLFYSYRRDKAETGRMASFIWIGS